MPSYLINTICCSFKDYFTEEAFSLSPHPIMVRKSLRTSVVFKTNFKILNTF